MRSALLLPLLAAGLAAPSVGAQPSTLVNARVTSRAVPPGGLKREVEAARLGPPHWVAYEVPSGAQGNVCCFSSISDKVLRGGGCRLEGDDSFNVTNPGRGAGRERLLVFYRMEKGAIASLRAFSGDCAIDAEGMGVVWLTGVPPEESVALLASLVEKRPAGAAFDDALADHALTVLALHGGKEAERALLHVARRDPDADARGQALFWLSQRAGEKAAAAIVNAVRDDPDVEVKEKAVFALSQLPDGEGIPDLVRLARTHRTPQVREKAIFWLGQSGDPRALELIEEILTK